MPSLNPSASDQPSRSRRVVGLVLQIVGVLLPFTAGFTVGLGFSVGGTTGWIAFSAIVAVGGIMWWGGGQLRGASGPGPRTGEAMANPMEAVGHGGGVPRQ